MLDLFGTKIVVFLMQRLKFKKNEELYPSSKKEADVQLCSNLLCFHILKKKRATA